MSPPPEPTELIYLPSATALPALVAVGLAGVVVGLYAWWPYSAAGAVLLLISLIAWLRRNRADIAEMPNRQQVDTAPLPLRK